MNSPIDLHSTASKNKKIRLNYYTGSFQLRDALWLAMIGMFCFCLMAFLLYLSLYRAAEGSSDPVLAKEILGESFNPRRIFTYFEVSVPLVVFLAFLVSIGIVATHRVAGPLFAIKRHMNRVRASKLRRPLTLRRNDELQDVAIALNAMLGEVWRREDEVAALLQAACNAASRGDIASAEAHMSKAQQILENAGAHVGTNISTDQSKAA